MRVSAIRSTWAIWVTDTDQNAPSHYHSWRLTGLMVFCAAVFTAGFIVREMGAFDFDNLAKFIASICLVYAAP